MKILKTLKNLWDSFTKGKDKTEHPAERMFDVLTAGLEIDHPEAKKARCALEYDEFVSQGTAEAAKMLNCEPQDMLILTNRQFTRKAIIDVYVCKPLLSKGEEHIRFSVRMQRIARDPLKGIWEFMMSKTKCTKFEIIPWGVELSEII
jgi:hypothetical protein